MEYLASTGESPGINLREVMKPSNRKFQSDHRGFGPWTLAMQQRRQRQQAMMEQRAAAAGGQQQQQQQQLESDG